MNSDNTNTYISIPQMMAEATSQISIHKGIILPISKVSLDLNATERATRKQWNVRLAAIRSRRGNPQRT